MLPLVVLHWVAHLPHTCTFSCGLQNGIMLTDTTTKTVSHLALFTETELLKCCLANKRKAQNAIGISELCFFQWESLKKIISKFFQQSDLFEASAVVKVLMGPGCPSCARDTSLLQPWIYCWNTAVKKSGELIFCSLCPLGGLQTHKVAAYGWKGKLYKYHPLQLQLSWCIHNQGHSLKYYMNKDEEGKLVHYHNFNERQQMAKE